MICFDCFLLPLCSKMVSGSWFETSKKSVPLWNQFSQPKAETFFECHIKLWLPTSHCETSQRCERVQEHSRLLNKKAKKKI